MMMYILVQIPAAIFSYKYSATHLFGICILGNSMLTMIFPIMSQWNDPPVVLIGLFHGLFMVIVLIFILLYRVYQNKWSIVYGV